MVINYLRENGYQGVIPEVLLTDEAHSFTVDSKDKETGAKRREKMGNENKEVLVGCNGIDGKEVTMSKFKEDINEIRDSRSIYRREVEK